MKLATFIRATATTIVAEWEELARSAGPVMTLAQRRDHVVGMLEAIAVDLDTPQTKQQQQDKSKGPDDAEPVPRSAASAHGVDRAASGYTPTEMVAEFRALRASVLRHWSEADSEVNRANLEELTRFNEAIDQLLAESIATYTHDVERSRDLMLGVLGHDLRTPLGAIMTTTTTMMSRSGPAWPQQASAARILKCVTRMDAMICDLVDFTRSRLGAGIPIVRDEIDLEAVCRQTVDEITAFHPECKVTVKASGDVHGRWDGGRIAQALSNLVGNARQHGRDDAPIDVELRGEPTRVVLGVHNQGPQIPAAQLREIFDPFRRLAVEGTSESDPQSVGLGLYIVQAIVDAHRGSVDVTSDARGTTFTVYLPR